MQNNWTRLDNAAKIFPSAVKNTDTQVFRFSCELYEKVDPILLQTALDDTIKLFDVFRCVLKRGVFWYYLESTDIRPLVKQEYKKPCSEIYNRDKKTLLFEITYFENRINLEAFHSLTDGTGAVNFLKTIVTKYLSLSHSIPEPSTDYGASSSEMEDDSFRKYYSGNKSKLDKKIRRSYRLHLPKLPDNGIRAITGFVDTKSLIDAAHRHGGSVTAFICGVFIMAIKEQATIRSLKRPIVINVPVNLRKYFKSETARNFFGLFPTEYKCEKETTLSEVVKKIDQDIKKSLKPDEIYKNIDSYSSVENNPFARVTPLFFKDYALSLAYDLSDLKATATVSNIGIVTIPDEIKDFVRSFGFYAGTSKIQACVTSYNLNTTICFTSPYISTQIQMEFFRTLVKEQIDVEITANNPDEVTK